MKILKPGTIPFSHVRINCNQCDCEFIAHKEKEVEHTFSQREGDDYYVICPCYGTRLYIADINKVLCDENGNKTQKKYRVPTNDIVFAVEGAHLPADEREEKEIPRWFGKSGGRTPDIETRTYGCGGMHCGG